MVVGESIEVSTLLGFMLALVRTTAWMAVCPPFNTKMIPRLVKLGAAASISIVMAPMVPADQMTTELAPLSMMILIQVATGLALGFLTQMLFAAVQAAGSLIDLFGGFTLSQAFDPFMNAQSSIFGRFYQLIATTLLFAMGGHLMLLKGFMTSFEAVPLGGFKIESFKVLMFEHITKFVVAAIEIAGPLLAAYFLAEIALGLLTKAAPQLNVITFGFPLKILLTLLLIASAIPMIPGAIENIVDTSVRDGGALLRMASGK